MSIPLSPFDPLHFVPAIPPSLLTLTVLYRVQITITLLRIHFIPNFVDYQCPTAVTVTSLQDHCSSALSTAVVSYGCHHLRG